VDGFYDPLLSFIDMAVNEGFIKEDARRIIISAPTAKELVLKLEVKFRSRSIALEAGDANFDRWLLTPCARVIRRSMFPSTRSVWCGRIRCRRRRTASPRSWSPGSPPPDPAPNQILTDSRGPPSK